MIYVNDIIHSLSINNNHNLTINIRLFADDTNLFISGSDFDLVSSTTNILCFDLNKWFIDNELTIGAWARGFPNYLTPPSKSLE